MFPYAHGRAETCALLSSGPACGKGARSQNYAAKYKVLQMERFNVFLILVVLTQLRCWFHHAHQLCPKVEHLAAREMVKIKKEVEMS